MILFESDSILKEIGSMAFDNCVIDSIVFAQFVENIGHSFLGGCQVLSLMEFQSESALKQFGSDAFRWSGLQSAVILRNVEVIGPSCFHCVNFCRRFHSNQIPR
jgi:hypothetical protein